MAGSEKAGYVADKHSENLFVWSRTIYFGFSNRTIWVPFPAAQGPCWVTISKIGDRGEYMYVQKI